MTATENRTDISIRTDDGVVLRGWLLAARGATSPAPLILLHNGFGGVKEGHLEKFGRAFAQAGFNVALRPFAVPALTAPFIVVTWIFLFARPRFTPPTSDEA